jgi:NADH pyrophosphatase NudC (nudix superfamily)
MKFCPECGTRVVVRVIDEKEREACSSGTCGFVHWNNPIPVIGCLVRQGDTFVLARNAQWPSSWFSIITGFMDRGETPLDTLCREVEEELGLRVLDARLVGYYPFAEANQLIVAHIAECVGEVRLSAELSEVKHVSADELAAYDFTPLTLTAKIVADALHTPWSTSPPKQSSRPFRSQ